MGKFNVSSIAGSLSGKLSNIGNISSKIPGLGNIESVVNSHMSQITSSVDAIKSQLEGSSDLNLQNITSGVDSIKSEIQGKLSGISLDGIDLGSFGL